jgi:hypothetical protein
VWNGVKAYPMELRVEGRTLMMYKNRFLRRISEDVI